MEQYATENIRNLVLLSHNGAGKTSLSEAILFDSKAVTRLGKTSEGTTTSDYDPIEVKRQISINLSVLPCAWPLKVPVMASVESLAISVYESPMLGA